VLYEVFGLFDIDADVRMHLALGTTMAIIVPISLRSFAGHRAKGLVDIELLKRIAPYIVTGVVLGSITAKYASADALKWVWVTAATCIAIKMAIGREDWHIAKQLPPSPWPQIGAFVVGFISTLMSIGGAIFIVTLLTLYGRSILQAVSTAAGVGPLIAIPGVIGYIWAGWNVGGLPPLSVGYVNVLAALIVAPVSVWATPHGVRLAHYVPRRVLELAFAAFLASISIRFLIDLLG
jgi:uncharacterized protein